MEQVRFVSASQRPVLCRRAAVGKAERSILPSANATSLLTLLLFTNPPPLANRSAPTLVPSAPLLLLLLLLLCALAGDLSSTER